MASLAKFSKLSSESTSIISRGQILERHASHKYQTDSSTMSSFCASGRGTSHGYNLPLHVGALFIILFVSFSACAFPILAVRFPKLRIPPGFLFLARHFGTGVLLATAFVHLLPTAFLSLTNQCLGRFWTESYPSMAGAISLAAIFFVTIVEMVFSRGQHCCSGKDLENMARAVNIESQQQHLEQSHAKKDQNANTVSERSQYEAYGIVGPRRARSNSTGREIQRLARENERFSQNDETDRVARIETPLHIKNLMETDDELNAHKKALLQCLLLELGILFHSVFIGIALSVATGRDFVVLLVAISFHQVFEGLALGSRISALKWDSKTIQPWLMALAYGCTTPVGQAIGLILHTSYSPESRAGLLMTGIMNAISSGLLIFASLVELMAEDFLSDESWETLRGKRRVGACFIVFLGAMGMGTIGAWA